MKSFFISFLLTTVLAITGLSAQNQPAYKLPDAYRFDYQVNQVVYDKKNAGDSSLMYFFYTKSGDYAAVRTSGKTNKTGNLSIVLTREGICVITDERSKKITIISIRKLASELTHLTKWIRMDSLTASMRNKGDRKDFQSVKTGKTKPAGNYQSEEYSITGSKNHMGSVWCAKVDFATPADYLLGAVGANWLQMMNNGRPAAHPLFQALTTPKTLITEIEIKDSTGAKRIHMHTVSIEQTAVTISTTGYTVNDYSEMTLPEIFQAEMKKRNN
ncbi:MAG: hypothetical protein M3N30_01095 [Bacteroidota bacterium]|nr:hypothetical protein [Bacteroidota bacterium]